MSAKTTTPAGDAKSRTPASDYYFFTSHGAFVVRGASFAKAARQAELDALDGGQVPEGERGKFKIFGGVEMGCLVQPGNERGPFVVTVMRNPGPMV